MKYLILCALIAVHTLSIAQIEAITKDGKSVLLFENGTWEFVTQENESSKESIEINIAEGLSKESPLSELYFAESKRLVKYFGPIKGKIKGRAKCIFTDGKPKIYFQWELGLLDSYRYFGQMKKGKKVTLITKSNTPIELILNEDIDIEFLEKYKFSILKGACVLTDNQFKLLMNSPVSEIKVDWKKEPETYKMNDAYYFSKTFQDLVE